MKILAIDSSTTPASVAVTENNAPLGEFTININRTHSEKLLPLVDQLLDEVGLKVTDIDAFAISAGPGSFTGLRIGMSAAKLMAQVSKKPLIAVGTLEGLAANVCAFEGYVCPMLDARNNTVNTALYNTSCSLPTEAEKPDAVSVDDLANKLLNLDSPVVITGEYGKYESKFPKETASGKPIHRAPLFLSSQRAVATAVVAYELLLKGVATDPNTVNPLYIRESQAEQAKKARKAK